jgi:hypothetical protein
MVHEYKYYVRIQSPKRCILKDKQDDGLGKDKVMNNVQNVIFEL